MKQARMIKIRKKPSKNYPFHSEGLLDTVFLFWAFGHSGFGFASDFDIRISDFHCRLPFFPGSIVSIPPASDNGWQTT
jgi:hypothetical protein